MVSTTARQAASAQPETRRRRGATSRQSILEATIDCFVDIGYARTTTSEIARRAGLTRGAVQHYFPTTPHALKASIKYLTRQWLEKYTSAMQQAPEGPEAIDYAVDTLWRFVNDRLFVAWQELVAASRTDNELRRLVVPAARRFDAARRAIGEQAFREFHEASADQFDRNRDLLRFVLEGMSSTIISYDRKHRVQTQIDWLKRWFHAVWEAEQNGARS